jgi:hypothetical protein
LIVVSLADAVVDRAKQPAADVANNIRREHVTSLKVMPPTATAGGNLVVQSGNLLSANEMHLFLKPVYYFVSID